MMPGMAFAQRSAVWVADKGDGTYRNPVIHADYSDPDAIRVGDDYYMISSSFNHAPGLPILHSMDLVNWRLIGHALPKQPPYDRFSKVQHGGGVWAPSIRYHKGEFYIYYPDPDAGIYMIKSKSILGPWSEPAMVMEGKGLIDPCPFWDENGKVYLAYAYAGSRAGIKSILAIKELNTNADAVMVFDGHDADPTVEGPKLYKRNGYYYIFAPAGGVSTGWQLVLRSRHIYGPYERKVVMDQGTTPVNGPHQGAWVDTKTGEDWFLHFQDKDAYGRIVHLQPMKWVDDWPVIGAGKEKGEPVLQYKKPNVGKTYPVVTPADSDEFDAHRLGLQWQWQANPKPYWAFLHNGQLRLFAQLLPDSARNYWNVTNLLMQKFPAEEFTVTTKMTFKPRLEGERAGLIVFGVNYAFVSLVKKADGNYISFSLCNEAEKGSMPATEEIVKSAAAAVYFRVKVSNGAVCSFSYSEDGVTFKTVSESLKARPGRWVGAKVGLFCTGTTKSNDAGFVDVDYFRVE